MPENVITNPGVGGAQFRSLFDAKNTHWPAGLVAYTVTDGAGAASTLAFVTPSAGLPVQPQTGASFVVADGGGSLTVDAPAAAPVFVRLSDGTNPLSTLPVSGPLTDAQLRAAAVAVSLASVPSHAVTNAGTFVVQESGAALTALQLIDDVVKAEDAPHASGDKGAFVLGVRKDTAVSLAGADGDYTAPIFDASGRLHVNVGNIVSTASQNTVTDFSTSSATFGFLASGWSEGDSDVRTLRTDSAGRLHVADGGGSITVDGAVAATQSGTWNVGTVSTLTSLSQWAGNAIDTNSGNRSAGTLRVVLATDQPQLTNKLLVTADPITFASAQAVTQSGAWTVQPGNTANSTPWLVSEQAATAGGAGVYSFLSTAAVQAASVKGSAGQVYGLHFFNTGAGPVYVRLYNQATAPGTGDTPVYRAIVPGNTAAAGFVVTVPPGLSFAAGIGLRVTGAVADNDATALSANAVVGNVLYK